MRLSHTSVIHGILQRRIMLLLLIYTIIFLKSVCLSVCLSACLSACLSVCLSVCLSAFANGRSQFLLDRLGRILAIFLYAKNFKNLGEIGSPACLFTLTRRATHVRNRVCPRVELILKIIIIFLGLIKS